MRRSEIGLSLQQMEALALVRTRRRIRSTLTNFFDRFGKELKVSVDSHVDDNDFAIYEVKVEYK